MEKASIPICIVSIMAIGRTSSIDPMSFENLLRILPEGFTLKNRIDVCTILVNMRLCKFLDAFMQNLKKFNDRVNELKITKTTKVL